MKLEYLVQVLRLVNDYLPLNDALNLLCLNTYLYEHLPNVLFKRIIVERAVPLLLGSEQHPETVDQILQSLDITDRSYEYILRITKVC